MEETGISLLREFGVPVAMLAAFGWAILTNRLRNGAETDKRYAAYDEQIRQSEKLRLEEREARIRAETRLDEALDVVQEVTQLAEQYSNGLRDAGR